MPDCWLGVRCLPQRHPAAQRPLLRYRHLPAVDIQGAAEGECPLFSTVRPAWGLSLVRSVGLRCPVSCCIPNQLSCAMQIAVANPYRLANVFSRLVPGVRSVSKDLFQAPPAGAAHLILEIVCDGSARGYTVEVLFARCRNRLADDVTAMITDCECKLYQCRLETLLLRDGKLPLLRAWMRHHHGRMRGQLGPTLGLLRHHDSL